MLINCINPPQTVLNEPTIYAHLGLLYLASVLEKRGHKVKYIDLSNVPPTKALDLIPQADAHLFTMNSAMFDAVKYITDRLEGYKVVGGVHPTIFPDDVSKLNIDAVLCGEGEVVISNIIENKSKGIFQGYPIKDLDLLPFPARHLVDPETFNTKVHGSWKGKKGVHLITSRGCPYNCVYCCRISMIRTVRFRSAENVAQEVKELRNQYKIHNFRFCDDNFTMDKPRVINLCKLLKPLDVKWMCITRADQINRTMLKAMYKSGCCQIDLGIESGSQRILDLMNKQTKVKNNIKIIKMIKKEGIEVKALLMIGFPTETEHDLELTKDFIRQAKPDYYTLSIFTPIPGSEVYLKPKKFGLTENNVKDRCKNFFFTDENDPHIKEFKDWLKKGDWKK